MKKEKSDNIFYSIYFIINKCIDEIQKINFINFIKDVSIIIAIKEKLLKIINHVLYMEEILNNYIHSF